MKRIGQSATEYMFMLAAALILVAFVTALTLNFMQKMTKMVDTYVRQVRKEVLENL